MNNKSSNINLIKGKGDGFLDKFIKWAITTGRIVVIITEIISLGAFFYRFPLDSKINDLKDIIKQDEKQLSELEKSEKKYMDIQLRLKRISEIEPVSQKFVNKLNLLKDIFFVKNRLAFNSMSIKDNKITISTQTDSPVDAKKIITEIKKIAGVKKISVDSFSNKASISKIIMTINIEFKDI
ncbi:MAG: hypothetical protein NTZ20_00100 [Candidatus Levybacteria bacterium]|nr:hypothetical protein [Candidatus Levybacteria bacterium]